MDDKSILVTKINEKLHKFYDETYGKHHILHNLKHLEWQFKNNPYHESDDFSLVIIENNDKIKSHLGYIPIKLKILDTNVMALWHVSFFTLEEFRGTKLGTKIIDLSNSFGDLSMVLSGSEGTKKIYTNMDGKDLGLLHRNIKILNKEKLERYDDTIKNIQVHQIIKPNLGKIERIKQLPLEYEKFWNNVKNRFPITIDRSKEYLIWRYFEHPIIDYHFLNFIVNDELQGYAVIRFEDNNEEIKAARLVDLICNESFDEVFLNHIISYCNSKVDFIDFFCTGNFYKNGLFLTNFFDNNENGFNIPTVFNPIDFNRRLNINFFVSNNSKNNYNIDLNNINNWYLVKSDSDQDRAN